MEHRRWLRLKKTGMNLNRCYYPASANSVCETGQLQATLLNSGLGLAFFKKKYERAFCYNLIYYWSQKVFDQGKHEFLVPGNQESTRPPGNSGKRKEITRKVPVYSRKFGVPSSAMLRWATRWEKHNHFFSFMIFILEIPGKDHVFDLFTVHFCAISRNIPRNYLNLIRNQDQEITLRAPGIRVCVDHNGTRNIVTFL